MPLCQTKPPPTHADNKTKHEFDKDAKEVITEKDLSDLKFGLNQGVNYVAMSFVGNGSDILKLRGCMQDFGKVVPIIAKKERKVGSEKHIVQAGDKI